MTTNSIDHTQAVQERYGAAASEQEPCLCCAGAFDPQLLEVIPVEGVERNYGCGDPSRWVRRGDVVLDLGSGSGKNAFICAQLVGPQGRVIGLDRNDAMLELACRAAPVVANKIGYANVEFRRAAIEQLDRDLEGALLLVDASVDVVLSNCVLNLVNPQARGSYCGRSGACSSPQGGCRSATSCLTDPYPSTGSRPRSCGAVASAAPGRNRIRWRPSVHSDSSMCTTPTARSSPGGPQNDCCS